MSRQTKIVNMSLPADTYAQIEDLARRKGVSKSQLLRESLSQYLASEQRRRRIRSWGEETARKLGIRDEQDVEKIIHQYRREKSQT